MSSSNLPPVNPERTAQKRREGREPVWAQVDARGIAVLTGNGAQ
jgi:hypothetical protein